MKIILYYFIDGYKPEILYLKFDLAIHSRSSDDPNLLIQISFSTLHNIILLTN